MLDGVTQSGAIPALERMLEFAARRHELIVGNIANLDTPGFRPVDVSVRGFREQLGAAIDHRRETGGPLRIEATDEVRLVDGRLELAPRPAGANLLFHDGNDRSLERIMQDLVENFSMFRFAAQMLQSRYDLIDAAIRERP